MFAKCADVYPFALTFTVCAAVHEYALLFIKETSEIDRNQAFSSRERRFFLPWLPH